MPHLGHLKHDVQRLCGIIVVPSDHDDAGAGGDGTGSECHLCIFCIHTCCAWSLLEMMMNTSVKVGTWKAQLGDLVLQTKCLQGWPPTPWQKGKNHTEAKMESR